MAHPDVSKTFQTLAYGELQQMLQMVHHKSCVDITTHTLQSKIQSQRPHTNEVMSTCSQNPLMPLVYCYNEHSTETFQKKQTERWICHNDLNNGKTGGLSAPNVENMSIFK